MMSTLGFLSYLNTLHSDLLFFNTLSTDIVLLFSFLFTEICNFLLLCHDFCDSLPFHLFSFTSATLTVFFDCLDSFVESLGLPFSVLVCPIFGSLLANLQLDFQRVELLYNRLISWQFIFVPPSLHSFFSLQEISFALAGLSILVHKSFITALFEFL